MHILVAKINGLEIDRKTVTEASPFELHLFRLEVERGVTKKFKDDIVIEVKNGRKVLDGIIKEHFRL